MAKKQLIFIDIDGILPDVLYEAIDDPESNISKLGGHGLRAEKAVTVFPAVTLSCQASMFTGVYPARHGVVGNLWFNRHSNPPLYRRYTEAKTAAGVYGFGLFGWPTIILPERPELMYANSDLSRDVKLIYEEAAEKGLASWQVFNQYSRGVTKWVRPSRPEMILFALCHEELVHNKRWDRATFRHLFKEMKKAELPDILVFYISGHDSNSHENGPETQKEYFREYVDPLFGDFIRELEKHRPIDEFHFMITSDHCQAKMKRDKSFVITNEELAEMLAGVPGGGFKLFDRKTVRDGDTAVVCAEAGAAQVHLMNRATGKWGDQPRFEEDLIPAAETIEKYKRSDKRYIDLILMRREFGAEYEVYEDGNLIKLEKYFEGKDAVYPDAVERIRGVSCEKSGDLTVLIDFSTGYYFGDKVKAGEHGNLRFEDSMIPFVVSGPGIPDKTIPFARLVDAAPTAAKIMGFDMHGADGMSVL